MRTSDLILINGNVLTMEPQTKKVNAVAIKDGVIVYVGNDNVALEFKNKKTEIINLKGKTLMPGFIESHMHPTTFGIMLKEVECRPQFIDSIEKLLESVHATAIITPKEEWICGRGWDESKMKEKRNPNRWDLDKVAPEHPVFLKRTCGHVAVANSKALALAKITKDTPDPEGGHVEKDPNTGEPTGILQERAQELLPAPIYTIDDYCEGFALAQKEFARWGITTVHDIAVENIGIKPYQRLLSQNKLNVRLRFWLFALKQLRWNGLMNEAIKIGLQSGYGNEMLRFQGMKFMLDGGIGGRTAALAEPYEGQPDNYGILHVSEKNFIPKVVACLKAGLRVAIHAIGERAIEVALNAIETATAEVNVKAMRNRIEHCAFPTDSQISRIKNMNIIAASSIAFLYSFGDSYYHNLGSKRLKRAFPHKTFIKHGITAPGNSDCPVCDGNPMLGIYAAVSRKATSGRILDETQNISVKEAIKAYTIDAAYSSFEENILGSIKENKFADMIVVSDNPLNVPVDSLKDINVEMTIMNGKITFSQQTL